MRKLFLLFSSLCTAASAQTAPDDYFKLCLKADSLYKAGDYEGSAFTYSSAFKSFGWKAYLNDRYNAACSWALANYPDSAFFNLGRIAGAGWNNLGHVSTDPDLASLHKDERWIPVLKQIETNKEKAEAGLDKPLVRQLEKIHKDDQEGRQKINAMGKKYGRDSEEMKELWKDIMIKDSLNLIEVKKILDTRGWLGPDVVGLGGSSTLFLVIQHSDLKTQEKYLPMMREAVKNGKAQASDLALLEDRVALRQGKKQIYGSQIGTDPETGLSYVLPLSDPEHVDQRRAEVGLQALADYVKLWEIKWDPEQYQKDLPELEKKSKGTWKK
jgi:hypothetical protein